MKIDGGEVFGAMRGTLDAYAGMGVSLKDVKPVAVLYHGYAIALGFDDLVWNQFFLPLLAMNATDERSIDAKKEFDTVVDPKKKGNPCLHKQGGDFDASIESLIADAGARIFMCNHATEGVASGVARKLGKNPADVYKTMSAHLVPNAMLVPAGSGPCTPSKNDTTRSFRRRCQGSERPNRFVALRRASFVQDDEIRSLQHYSVRTTRQKMPDRRAGVLGRILRQIEDQIILTVVVDDAFGSMLRCAKMGSWLQMLASFGRALSRRSRSRSCSSGLR